jgi:hypothetical protein
MNYLSTLSDVEVEEYQEQKYSESPFSTKDLSGTRKRSIVGQVADEIARTAISLVRSGRVMSVDVAVQVAMEAYCANGRCAPTMSGLGDDQSILDAIVSDAKDVQARHKLLINNMAGWEEREPGRLTIDDDLRNEFIGTLASIKDQFVQRGLSAVGVTFPYQLDRTNPAHAIILAVRDDIADTISLLEAKKAQAVVAKEVQEIKSLPAILRSAVPTAPNFTPVLDFGKYLLWGAGILGAAIVFSKFGGRS